MPKISQTYFSLANVTPTILMLSSLAGQPVLREIPGADGLLLSTPEYNNGIPGVFKNAIDWASRPASDIERVFGGKKAALMGASPGSFGTLLSQNDWLPVLRTLGVNLWTSGRMLVPRAHAAFDEAGQLADSKLRERLATFLQGFVTFMRE